MSENHNHGKKGGPRDGVFSKRVPAGRRTYFFDVRATKGGNDYYITVTESKKIFGDDGSSVYEKHKIFIYGDDFEKFKDGLNECLDKAAEYRSNPSAVPVNQPRENNAREEERSSEPDNSAGASNFTDVNFEDLK